MAGCSGSTASTGDSSLGWRINRLASDTLVSMQTNGRLAPSSMACKAPSDPLALPRSLHCGFPLAKWRTLGLEDPGTVQKRKCIQSRHTVKVVRYILWYNAVMIGCDFT